MKANLLFTWILLILSAACVFGCAPGEDQNAAIAFSEPFPGEDLTREEYAENGANYAAALKSFLEQAETDDLFDALQASTTVLNTTDHPTAGKISAVYDAYAREALLQQGKDMDHLTYEERMSLENLKENSIPVAFAMDREENIINHDTWKDGDELTFYENGSVYIASLNQPF